MSLQGNTTPLRTPRLATRSMRLTPEEMPTYFLAEGITADRIGKIEVVLDTRLDKSRIELGIIAKGGPVSQKTHLDVYYMSSAVIGSIVRSNSLRMVEATPDVLKYARLVDAIDALSCVKDPKRNQKVSDLYAPVPLMPRRLTQYVIDVNSKECVEMKSIVSLRILTRWDAIIGIRLDKDGRGEAIVWHRMQASDIASMQDPNTWTVITMLTSKRAFVALSRPRMGLGSRTNVIVTLEDGYEVNLSLAPVEGGGFSTRWGEPVPMYRSAIGYHGSSDVFASYVAPQHGLEANIELAPSSSDDPVALKYLEI
jgi:hypothetical protein